MTDLACGWARAALALALLRVDPQLGGAVIRMRASPLRTPIVTAIKGIHAPRQVHPAISDGQLFGGIDVAATLAAGTTRRSAGVLDGSAVLVTMADRVEGDLAARLALAMDDGRVPMLFALDEGASEEEGAPAALADRVAFHIAPDTRYPSDWAVPDAPHGTLATYTDSDVTALTMLAQRLGIDSLRAPMLALRAAQAHAVLQGRGQVAETDIAAAVALVLAHRATQMPEAAEPEPEAQNTTEDTPNADKDDAALPDADMMIDAVQALLPPDLLATLAQPPRRSAAGTGAGQHRLSNRRGRPLPPRPGRLDGRARIDLIATLRAAAPWQPLRRQRRPDAPGLIIATGDIRVKRFKEMSDRVLIFAVDASGSAAMSRLGEAKGAIELLLSEAYAKRDHVALIAFRGAAAEPLLLPTRSLVQTKRQLADLPGGGGTPLAAGLRSAFQMGQVSTARGMSPTLVLLTDGRANIALDGAANRAQAGADARQMAQLIRGAALPGLVIDTGKRPTQDLRALAQDMDAPYLPLPRADARTLSTAVSRTMAEA
ncbi:MAG: magnesium chelatase subunit D [Pseudomonadota bacterium]